MGGDLRVGVDVGGTFTDLIVRDATGRVVVAKELSSPSRPEESVLAVLDGALDGALADARAFVHGTTVGLNALLERRGAVVGLLATGGFRDVLEIRRGDRDDPYDLFWRAPDPLVPRRLRIPVAERIRADGRVHAALDAEDVVRAAARFEEEGVDAVAIAFLNAYANPAHELAAERLLREHGFAGEISLSHRVSGEYREYERTCTTVVDAFVRRRLGGYLRRLGASLADRGFDGSTFVTGSGGGAMSFGEALERPFETIISGPVAGVAAVTELARELQLSDVIAADVGGTSFDTCLIVDGRPPLLYQGEVIGLPLQTPWVDVRSIGAGGGSIAAVDAGGLLRVGPRSAGAWPGPACYGRGGTEPTVTDAALALGMLPAGTIAGSVALAPDLAERALAPLAERLGFDTPQAVARGVIQIACAHMADAIRGITVERGRDPRAATIVAFGGAGPVFGTLLARELGAAAVIVPSHAGNFSAWGLLGVDLAQTASRTRVTPLSAAALREARGLIAELLAEIDRRSERPAPDRRVEVHVDMRYVGQEHTLTIAVPAADDGTLADDELAVRDRFLSAYQRGFGHTMDEAHEIVTFRAVAVTPLPTTRPRPPDRVGAGRDGADGRRPAAHCGPPPRSAAAWSFTRDEPCDFATLDRAHFAPGDEIAGPVILREPTTTTYLDAGFTARVHATGHLVIEEAR